MSNFIEEINKSSEALKDTYKSLQNELTDIELLSISLLPDSFKKRHREIVNSMKIIDGAIQAYNFSIKNREIEIESLKESSDKT